MLCDCHVGCVCVLLGLYCPVAFISRYSNVDFVFFDSSQPHLSLFFFLFHHQSLWYQISVPGAGHHRCGLHSRDPLLFPDQGGRLCCWYFELYLEFCLIVSYVVLFQRMHWNLPFKVVCVCLCSLSQVDITKCRGLFCVLAIVMFLMSIVTAIVLSFKYVSSTHTPASLCPLGHVERVLHRWCVKMLLWLVAETSVCVTS